MANHRSVSALLLGALIGTSGAFAACGGCGDKEQKKPGEEGESQDAAQIPEFDAGSIHTEKLTPEVLLPVIQAIGFAGVVPKRVTVQFSRNIIDDGPRSVGDDTVFSIEPQTPGSLQFTGNSTLEFVPRDGFLPETTYAVTLSSVDSRKGPMIPPTPWAHEFTTPPFAFNGLSAAYIDEKTRQVELDMRFSAPVDPNKVGKYASWEVNGDRATNVSYSKGSEPHVVRVFLKHPGVEGGSRIALDLDDGVPFGDGKITAAGGQAEVTIEAGKPVNLYAAVRREGPEGYYIEVICKDESAPGGERYYYDRVTYDSYRVSRRCLPDEESLKGMITFNPPVKFRVGSGEGGFNILGDFRRGNYAMKIESGLRTIDGGVVRTTFEQEVTIPSRTPAISFVDKGRYVPRHEWKRLAVNHLNVDEVEISVRHVPERNAVFWMSGHSERADSRTSTLVAKERVKFTSKTDERETSFVDVAKLVGNPEPGLYEVTVAGLGQEDAIRLVPTDINLVVKRSATKPNQKWADGALVWAIDMKTLKPVSGVRVDLVRPSGESMSTCDTDDSGVCKMSIPVETIDPEPPFAIVAKKGDDFTYLKYSELQTRAADAEITGKPYLAEAAYHAAIWSDRGVYRPGETAHLVAVLRNDDFFAPTGEVPVEVEIKDPRQRVMTKQVLKSNDAGVITIDQKFSDFATTGFHTMELTVAKKKVASYRFNVEEFVPERMKVSADIGAKDYAMGEEVNVDVTAEYLFGGSAEGSNVELTCRAYPEEFKPAQNGEYYYGLASVDARPMDLQPVTLQLDAEGVAQIPCPTWDETASLQQTARLEATAAVFEAGSGRTTTAMAKTTVHPARYYVGLKSKSETAKAGQDIVVEGIVVDWNGKPYVGVEEIEIQFMRLEREYWWYYDDEEGESNYGRNIRPVVEASQKVKVGKDGKFRVQRAPGEHASAWVVAAVTPNSRTELKFTGSYDDYDYYWDEDGEYYGRTRRIDETPRPGRPTTMKIEGPESIEVQKPATFTFDVPFKGRMLVTAETHEVLTHEWFDVKPGKFEWRFSLAEFTPNIYVSGLLVKDPHVDSKDLFMPDRAYAVQSVRVEPTDKLHTVKVTAPEEIRPNSTLTVQLDLGPRDRPTFATVAAVDEGILSLTRFKTPDPSKELFSKRALGVETFETVGWALQSTPGGPSSKTGGGWDEDGEFGDGKGRVMPVKPVALWSGLVQVPESGKATVSFEVPRYRGALRVMAVTADASRTGNGEAKVYVREPVVLTTTLPRFLSAGDEIQVPVFVTNMTGATQTIQVSMDAAEEPTPGMVSEQGGDIVSFRGPKTKTLTVPDKKSATAVFAVQGLRQAGTAKFVVKAESSVYTAVDEGIVPFRPNGPHERITQIVELKSGTNDLKPYLEGWIPTSETTTVWVTSIPYGEAFSHLKYLIRYPYGCIEQTTSSTRPLLYVSQLVGQIDPEMLIKGGGIEKMVAHGIDRVLSMQTASGGFGYWPGSTHPDDWGTAYATHMLLDAQKAGFSVPQERVDKAIQYLDDSVTRRSSTSGQGYFYSEPYMHYVLARAGKGHKARIQRLIDQLPKEREGVQLENEYLLKAALWLAGDRRYEKQLRDPDTSTLKDSRESRWTYYSDRRRRAMMLSMFHDMFGNHKDGEKLARVVAQNLSEGRSSRWYTTQEIMWGVTGLGKWTEGAAADFGDAKLVINGKRPKPQSEHKGRADRSWSVHRLSEYENVGIELSNKKGKVYAMISSDGVREGSEAKVGGNKLSVYRRYYDAEGNQLEPTHQLGDLVYVEVKIENLTSDTLYNLALVDRLPAGWEIENPRLGRGTLPEWVDEDDLWQPEYMNLRDDRLEAFGNLASTEPRTLVYAVRVTSAGEFTAPPPEIEGMYEPEYWARDEPMHVVVRGPWDALLD